MARQRIEDIEDVRKLDRDPDFQRVPAKHVNPNDHVGAQPVHSVAGTGMDGIQIDVQLLADTERELAKLHDELVSYMNTAGTLTDSPRDGTSPVAQHMRRAFLDRADSAGGLQRILRDYLQELVDVRTAILLTLGSYHAMDEYAAAQLTQHAADLAHEEED